MKRVGTLRLVVQVSAASPTFKLSSPPLVLCLLSSSLSHSLSLSPFVHPSFITMPLPLSITVSISLSSWHSVSLSPLSHSPTLSLPPSLSSSSSTLSESLSLSLSHCLSLSLAHILPWCLWAAIRALRSFRARSRQLTRCQSAGASTCHSSNSRGTVCRIHNKPPGVILKGQFDSDQYANSRAGRAYVIACKTVVAAWILLAHRTRGKGQCGPTAIFSRPRIFHSLAPSSNPSSTHPPSLALSGSCAMRYLSGALAGVR